MLRTQAEQLSFWEVLRLPEEVLRLPEEPARALHLLFSGALDEDDGVIGCDDEPWGVKKPRWLCQQGLLVMLLSGCRHGAGFVFMLALSGGHSAVTSATAAQRRWIRRRWLSCRA